MIKRKNDGFVIEMMIYFMLICFGLCLLILTYMGSLRNERNIANQTVNMQTDLNQIGEYYLRYIEESGEKFPDGTETDFSASKYNWMDDEAKAFFLDTNERFNLKYEASFSIIRESGLQGLLNFFKTKYIWRKLTVKTDDNKIKMVIDLKEQRVKGSDTGTEYYIENWSLGDDLTDEYAGSYQNDDLSILQRLWVFIGLEINSIEDLIKNGDWLAFFIGSINNFQAAWNNRPVK